MILSVRSLTVFEENIVVTVFKLVPLFFQSLIAGEGGGGGVYKKIDCNSGRGLNFIVTQPNSSDPPPDGKYWPIPYSYSL